MTAEMDPWKVDEALVKAVLLAGAGWQRCKLGSFHLITYEMWRQWSMQEGSGPVRSADDEGVVIPPVVGCTFQTLDYEKVWVSWSSVLGLQSKGDGELV